MPVPAPDPVRLLRAAPRLRGILEDTSAALVLTSDAVIAAARTALEPAMFALAPWMALSDLPEAAALESATSSAFPATDRAIDRATGAAPLAYLQYTSGSTMSPRGVRLTHAQVLSNVQALNDAGHVTPESRVLTWLPHFHDYGLVHGVIAPLCAGATSWLMSPLVFLRRPLRWIEALATLRITHSGAPASAYVACLRALDGRALSDLPNSDLSSLVSLTCGAEPIRADTVAQVLAVFGDAGMSAGAFTPGYGLAETVLGVSVRRVASDGETGRAPMTLAVDAEAFSRDRIVVRSGAGDIGAVDSAASRALVGCGEPLAGTEVAIVDSATSRRVEDGVGEIWVRSPSVGDGYWRQPESSREVFSARLADGTGPFLRTGDLGFLHRGQLFVTGRSKDLVIVHGGNHYPQDLEWTAEHAHPALRLGYGAAFSVDGADGEELVLALETERRVVDLDAGAIATAVRRAIGEIHGLAVETLVLVRSGSLPRSSSGKIQRNRCRQQFLDGALEVQAVVSRADSKQAEDDTSIRGAATAPVSLTMPRDETEQAIWDIWREVLGTASFGVHESFYELGGTSLLMTQVASRIGQRMGVELPMSVMFDESSVGALADHVTRAMIDGAGQGKAKAAPIQRVPRGRPLPVSLSQRRMWLIQQFDPASSAYNVAISLRVRGALDTGVLQRAVDLMVERHESLRTRLVLGTDEPMQVIEDARPMAIEHIDLSTHADPEQAARALFAERIATPFDLARAPLHRATLLHLGEQDHALMWVMHHAIADNWSFTVLMREALDAYAAWTGGGSPEAAPVPIEYADYAAWQRSPAAVAQRRPQMDYWRERLANLSPLDLATDFPRPARPSFRGGRASATLSPQLRSAVRAFCAHESVTPFVVLLAVFKLMLARQVRGTDIAVGTPVANRHRFNAEHLVGTLVNTLVMRTDLSGDPTFEELVRRVRGTAVGAYMHQEAPFDELVETLGHDRTVHPEGLVRVLFNVLNAPLGHLDHAGLDIEEFVFDRSTAQFDLSVHIDTEFTHRVHFEYATDLYDVATIERMRDNYLCLLEAVLAKPTQAVSAFPIVAPAQLALMRNQWNATQTPLPAELTVPRYLPVADRSRHGDVALCDADGRTLRYGELEARSNALARALRARGIGRGHRVGLGVKRDAVMVVAMLGVLKSGAAYVPLDPGFPPDRLNFMAEDAGLSALLTRGVPAGWLADAGVPLLSLRDDGGIENEAVADVSALAPDARHDARPLDVAYMIYTSGSTGRPKGVAVPHRAVVNFLASMARKPGLSAADRLVAVTTLSFDIAVLELLLPLAVGAQVIIADASQVQDPHALRDLLAQHDATVMQATPTLWRMLLDAGWTGRDSGEANCSGFKALVGGEPMPQLLAEQLVACNVEVWNMYGPTETTVWSTVWRVDSPRAGISIGRPIDNTTVQVLDEAGHPCPIGVPGELCIGGTGVTLGYHRRDELTADRFPQDGDSADEGARRYRTGDLGRWRHDGWLEHLGRLDRQVKLRGLRIELGEIESALLDHRDVAQCVVDARSDRAKIAGREQDVRLVAYMVPRDGDVRSASARNDIGAMREHLRKRLPDYMLPQHVVWLKALPLLPNGKIDRNALPAPQVESRSGSGGGGGTKVQRMEPTMAAEHAIAAVWRELLGVEEIDLRDNFFDLGGHSLLAMRAVVAIREKLGWEIAPPRLVYETLGQIARRQNLDTLSDS